MLRLLLFLIFILLASCGVKNDPLNPSTGAYPSLVEDYHQKVKKKYHDIESSTVTRE